MDTDQSGFITLHEYWSFIPKAGPFMWKEFMVHGIDDEYLYEAYTSLSFYDSDENEDGVVTYDEMLDAEYAYEVFVEEQKRAEQEAIAEEERLREEEEHADDDLDDEQVLFDLEAVMLALETADRLAVAKAVLDSYGIDTRDFVNMEFLLTLDLVALGLEEDFLDDITVLSEEVFLEVFGIPKEWFTMFAVLTEILSYDRE